MLSATATTRFRSKTHELGSKKKGYRRRWSRTQPGSGPRSRDFSSTMTNRVSSELALEHFEFALDDLPRLARKCAQRQADDDLHAHWGVLRLNNRWNERNPNTQNQRQPWQNQVPDVAFLDLRRLEHGFERLQN